MEEDNIKESKDNIKEKDSEDEINELNLVDNWNNITLSEYKEIEKLKMNLNFYKINKNDFKINTNKILMNKVNDVEEKDKYSPKNIKLLKIFIEDSYCNYILQRIHLLYLNQLIIFYIQYII